MEEFVKILVKKYYSVLPQNITNLGGGYYGRVFCAFLEKGERIVIKFHLRKEMAYKEKIQIETLKKAGNLKMPQIYFFHKADSNIPYDALLMEYLEGRTAGEVEPENEEMRKQMADKVIDNLIAYHNTIHTEGFGEIDDKEFEKDWRSYYKKIVDLTYQKACTFYRQNLITTEIMNYIDIACQSYDKIFYLPITKAGLIHGDYNMWNILIDEQGQASAVIDPCGGCYADTEYDLYQLNNANGKQYRLLDNYKSKVRLSENYEIKLAFYEVFTELKHYYDAEVNPILDILSRQSEYLMEQMERFGIKKR